MYFWKIAFFWWLFVHDVRAQRKRTQATLRPLKPEEIHYPGRFTTTERIIGNASEYDMDYRITPDFRIEEAPPHAYWPDWYQEMGRPFSLSPFDKQAYRWHRTGGGIFELDLQRTDNVYKMGCYCCTVYMRLTPLATCAVLTTRHILTTATSTELILKEYGNQAILDDILGLWYDRSGYVYNSSMYSGVSRIHYHPRYVMPNNVNASHPLPCVFDLAVWAATYPFLGTFFTLSRAYLCNRAGSHMFDYSGPTVWTTHHAMVIGYQFMWYYKRVPMPWFKYVIRTKEILTACPKGEWGWFICLYGKWAQLGLDSGSALHRNSNGYGWKYDGLLGINSFSMTLRAKTLTHYFTVLENWSTMDFLYDSYMGTIPYRWLDGRFYDTRWKAPMAKPWYFIPWKYELGAEDMWVNKYPSWNK